ncbi:MAG: MotA/TolQ/ExbB proton channel family protein [Spirochaetes bacterium]|nr:MAG: MotA/TolQ/ExbB proton channel family protein [Spirochaetota bacterium]
MVELFSRGGPLMVPIIISSLLSVAIIIERSFYFNRLNKVSVSLSRQFNECIELQNFEGCIGELRKYKDNPISSIYIELFKKAKSDIQNFREYIETIAGYEVKKLEKFLPALATISYTSPLLGILGTVTGMIRSFSVLSQSGIESSNLLAKGISEALITTASGLAVAIPSIIFYNIFSNKANKIVLEIEYWVETLLAEFDVRNR